MRGKRAKLLRKFANFEVHEKRPYSTHKVATKLGKKLILMPGNKFEIEERPVDKFQTFCESNSRLRYKVSKRAWKKFDGNLKVTNEQLENALKILEKQSSNHEEEKDGSKKEI